MADYTHVELWYPRVDDRPNGVRVDLVDVRAADGIWITYDFQRDGWVIQQEVFKHRDQHGCVYNMPGEEPELREAAFIPAWQFVPEVDRG